MNLRLRELRFNWLPDPFKAYVVDGKQIRDKIEVDFTAGGNGYRYDFIPKSEIWVDDGTNENEYELTALHEWVELNKMRQGYNYDDAHSAALAVESVVRRVNQPKTASLADAYWSGVKLAIAEFTKKALGEPTELAVPIEHYRARFESDRNSTKGNFYNSDERGTRYEPSASYKQTAASQPKELAPKGSTNWVDANDTFTDPSKNATVGLV